MEDGFFVCVYVQVYMCLCVHVYMPIISGHTRGEGGGGEGCLPDFHNFFGNKNVFFHENYKYDQNGLIHPEN